jgi:hypothetical protein
MKTFVTAIAVCFLVAGLSARQDPTSPQTPQKPAVAEITVTGCLVQGSTPAVFIFENVRKDPKSTTEPAVKYVVIAATEDLNLLDSLNHQVRIVGLPDGKVAPPTTQKVEEKDLPRLSAKSLTVVADTCSSPAR